MKYSAPNTPVTVIEPETIDAPVSLREALVKGREMRQKQDERERSNARKREKEARRQAQDEREMQLIRHLARPSPILWKKAAAEKLLTRAALRQRSRRYECSVEELESLLTQLLDAYDRKAAEDLSGAPLPSSRSTPTKSAAFDESPVPHSPEPKREQAPGRQLPRASPPNTPPASPQKAGNGRRTAAWMLAGALAGVLFYTIWGQVHSSRVALVDVERVRAVLLTQAEHRPLGEVQRLSEVWGELTGEALA
ncbi:MAG: hypothetical protein ACI4SV_03265, partial [Duodenibacillus sp.]